MMLAAGAATLRMVWIMSKDKFQPRRPPPPKKATLFSCAVAFHTGSFHNFPELTSTARAIPHIFFSPFSC